jgi:hypothetical protein
MFKGCCSGLICTTSHINPNYGVCIPGEGEHLAVTTRLVVPASDGGMAQMAAELVEAEEAAAAAETVLAEQATAKDSRRSTCLSRCGMDKAGARPMVAARRPRY